MAGYFTCFNISVTFYIFFTLGKMTIFILTRNDAWCHFKSPTSSRHFYRSELTWGICMAVMDFLSDSSTRTHRPSTQAGWKARHPCAWCPQSQASPKVSKLQPTPKTLCTQDAHSRHASRRKHCENLSIDNTVFNLTEEGVCNFA